MKISTSKRINFYPQGQQFVARALCILWLLASSILEIALATGDDNMRGMKAALESAIGDLDNVWRYPSSSSSEFPQSYSLGPGAKLSGARLSGMTLSGLSSIPANEPSELVPSHGFDLRLIDGTPVEIGDLLQLKEIRRVLVTGAPGTGKTQLGEYLTEQWGKQKWGQKFLNLYLLPVSILQKGKYDGWDYKSKKTLATAIVNHCCTPPNQKKDYLQLREGIEEQLKDRTTLVILDGLDEREEASAEILQQAQAGVHKLLMLSRPYGVERERQIADLEVEHMGFNEDYLRSSIWSRLEHELAESFWTYIKGSESMQKIVKIPLCLELSCALWQDAGVRKALENESLSDFYQKLAQGIWDRYAAKWQLGDVPCHERFNTLGQIALEAFEPDKKINTKAEKHLRDSGLLQYVERRSEETPFCYQFLNQTFQEYFAGRWLAAQFAGDSNERKQCEAFLRHNKYNSSYGHTLAFLSGELSRQLVAQNKSIEYRRLQLSQLLGLMDSEPKETGGLQQVLLQVTMLHEWLCRADKDDIDDSKHFVKIFPQVFDTLQKWLSKIIKMSYLPQAQKKVEELMNDYWENQDATLIPYIVWKLHQTPLVIRPSQRSDSPKGQGGNDTEVALYLEGGGEQVWQGSSELIAKFRALLEGESANSKNRKTFHVAYEDARKALSDYERVLTMYEHLWSNEMMVQLGALLEGANNRKPFHVAYEDARKALSDYERVLTMYEHLSSNRLDMAHAWHNLGDAWMDLDARKAMYCYERALAIFEQFQKHKPQYHSELIGVLCAIGNCHVVLRDIFEAVNCHKQALTIFEQIRDEKFGLSTVAMVSSDMGMVYVALEDPYKAVTFLSYALKILQQICENETKDLEIARTLNNLGIAYFALRELYEALNYYDRALVIFEKAYKGEPKHPEIVRAKESRKFIKEKLKYEKQYTQ